MCGIFGVAGSERPAHEVKIGLEKLAYRGYDSAGIACFHGDKVLTIKVEGHPEELDTSSAEYKEGPLHSAAIGHNRWATHSLPTKENAHPYVSNDGTIHLVHNGIIENYLEVKQFLIKKGFTFQTTTDTEVLPNLIQYFMEQDPNQDLISAVSKMSKKIRGAYAIAFLHTDFPSKIQVARLGSPICIARTHIDNKDGFYTTYVSSDVSSLASKNIRDVFYLENKRISLVSAVDVQTYSFTGNHEGTNFKKVSLESSEYSIGEYSSFMEKEIKEQPIYAKNAVLGRLSREHDWIKLSGIDNHLDKIEEAEEIYLVGCGSAHYAAEIGAIALETLAGKRARAVPAGELQYLSPYINNKTVMIAISQSGETADTIGCIEMFKKKHATCLGLVNAVDSTISRLVDAGIYIRAGQEVSVASTKAVTNQIINLIMLSVLIGGRRKLSEIEFRTIVKELNLIPDKIGSVLSYEDDILQICKKYYQHSNIICVGRGELFTIAKELALKIKEISYIHAEGFSAAELKHGPLALIDESTPTIALVNDSFLEEKIFSNLKEIKSRSGKIVIIANNMVSKNILDLADDYVVIPSSSNKIVESILFLVASQFFAYHLAMLNDRPIDRPRNLAKSVTVE